MDGETDMLTSNNVSQLRYLLKLTRFDVLTWKRTADRNETFTTSSCEATFVATVWEDSLRRYFRLSNRDGKVLILASSADIDLLATLFAEVKNRAFDVNRAIASIVRLGVRDIPDDRSALSRKRGITCWLLRLLLSLPSYCRVVNQFPKSATPVFQAIGDNTRQSSV
jgi:hypothetical protein